MAVVAVGGLMRLRLRVAARAVGLVSNKEVAHLPSTPHREMRVVMATYFRVVGEAVLARRGRMAHRGQTPEELVVRGVQTQYPVQQLVSITAGRITLQVVAEPETTAQVGSRLVDLAVAVKGEYLLGTMAQQILAAVEAVACHPAVARVLKAVLVVQAL